MMFSHGSFTINLVNLQDSRKKNIYGLGAGISTVFKIFRHFPFEGGGGSEHPHSHPGFMTYMPFEPFDTRNKNIYG